MTLSHRIRFYQQLAVLARAGVSMRASLIRLQERISGRQLAVLSQQVNAGEKLADAFAAAGFSPFECHLIAAGERSARLETVFQHLADFWGRRREMMHALMQPLYYPLAVLHFAVFAGALIELTTTAWDVVVIHLLARLGLLYLVGFIIFLAVRLTWSSEIAQRIWHFVPLIGGTLSTACAYRWITALRLEYTAGIPISNAVADAWRASGYVGRERCAREGEQAIREGTELSTLVQRWKQLPRDWIDFIETGEISGALETAFENLEAEADRAWTRARQRVNEWLPKILYFLVLLIAAAQVASVLYKVIVAPMTDAQNAIDQALDNK